MGPTGSTGNECIFAKLSLSSSSSWAELALFSVSPADGLHNIAYGLHNIAYGLHSIADGLHNIANGLHNIEDGLHNIADGLHSITDVMIYNLVLIS